MSLSAVRTYARERVIASTGREEWNDVSWKNIPRTNLDRYFHVEFLPAFGIQNNQDNQDIDSGFLIRLFMQPDRYPNEIVDRATELADTVLADILSAGNRTTQLGIKNVRFDNMAIEPLDTSNDNGLVIQMSFTAHVIISTR